MSEIVEADGSRRPRGLSIGAFAAIALATLLLTCVAMTALWAGVRAFFELSLRVPDETHARAGARFAEYVRSTPAPKAQHTLTIRVFADEEYRDRKEWAQDARALISAASAILERDVETQLTVLSVSEFSSADDAPSLVTISESATSLVGELAELHVLLVGQTAPSGASEGVEYDRAYSPYYGRLITMRPRAPDEQWGYDRETIAQAVGHALGAWHSHARETVMRMHKRGRERHRFDRRSRRVIAAALRSDVRGGVDAVDTDTQAMLLREYSRDREFSDEQPLAYALFRQAYFRMRRGDDSEAVRADLERAESISRKSPERSNVECDAWSSAVREWLDEADR